MCNWFVVVPRPWTGRKGHVSEFGNRNRYGFGMTLQILARPCVCPTFVARSRPELPTAYAVDAFGMCVSLLHLLEDFSAASSSLRNVDVFSMTSRAIHSPNSCYAFAIIHVRSMEIQEASWARSTPYIGLQYTVISISGYQSIYIHNNIYIYINYIIDYITALLLNM